MISRRSLALALLLCATLSGPAVAEDDVKVVYHMVDGLPQAQRAVGNIRNHLNADPRAKIVVVGHGPGIDFMLDGATDSQGRAFSSAIADLSARGVEFKVCNNTLVGRNIPRDKVVMEANVVPSGVAEIARLQAREGFVYLRP